MSKKPTPEEIELNEYLSRLTDIGLDTQSKAIFHLTEIARDSELFKSEKEVLKSFIEWATLESEKLIKPIGTDISTGTIDPNQTELSPMVDIGKACIECENAGLINGMMDCDKCGKG